VGVGVGLLAAEDGEDVVTGVGGAITVKLGLVEACGLLAT
jgi:hypothetical protein